MSDLSIPRFLDREPGPLKRLAVGRPRGPDWTPPVERRKATRAPQEHLDRRLVAAIRYDYEVALMSMADVVRKYHLVVSAWTARRIMHGDVYKEVKAAHHRLAWCKRSWRK